MIDLGQYLRLFLRWAWLIGLFAVLGALAGFAYYRLQPVQYASAVSLLVKPSPEGINVTSQAATNRIDPIAAAVLLPPVQVRTIAYLADDSAEIERRVQRTLASELGNRFPERLRETGSLFEGVEVREVAGRPNVMEVRFEDPDEELSIRVANLYANVAAEYLNDQLSAGFYNPDAAAVQLRKAETALGAQQAALNRFERTSTLLGVAARLARAQSLQNDLDRQRNQLQLALGNAGLIREQIRAGGANAASSTAIQLLALTSFTTQASEVDVSEFLPPIQGQPENNEQTVTIARQDRQGTSTVFQPTLDQLGNLTRQQQVAFVGSLESVLAGRVRQLDSEARPLAERIANLRADSRAIRAQLATLELNQRTALSNYEALRGLINQSSVVGEIQSERISITKPAVQAESAGGGGLVPILQGAGLGLLLGTLAALILQFARGARSAAGRAGAGAFTVTRTGGPS